MRECCPSAGQLFQTAQCSRFLYKMAEFDTMQFFDILGLEMLPQGGNSFIKSVSLTLRYYLENITGSLVKKDLQLVQLMLCSPASNLSCLLEPLDTPLETTDIIFSTMISELPSKVTPVSKFI